MEFLKAILGEELYAQVETAINAHNGKPENHDKQLKLADLGGGEYVSKGKYSTLEAENQTNASKLAEANNLIAQLQKAAKGDETLQNQVTAYQTKAAQLEEELKKTKIENAVKIGLLSEKCVDVDYVAYKITENLKAQGKSLELDDADKIKGWDELLNSAKTQLPTQFESGGNGGNGGFQPIGNGGLPKPGGEPTVTREQFASMSFEERMNLKKSNEALYKQYAKN